MPGSTSSGLDSPFRHDKNGGYFVRVLWPDISVSKSAHICSPFHARHQHNDKLSPLEMNRRNYDIYNLGEFALKLGGDIPIAFIAYKTFGHPSNPAIIYPTWFSGSLEDNYWLVGEGKALDPTKYFIIIPALFGNGQSSSPSNLPTLRPFPNILFYDNVRAQYELVTKHLGVKHAFAVLGWSMGASQT